jgi:hypothetical protein
MKNAISTVLFVALAGTAQAFDPPDAELLKSNLATELPAYWLVTDVRIEASANYGDEVDPLFRQRAVATIEPGVDLFVEAKQADGVIFLRPETATGERRQLFLLATSALHAGTWRPQFERQSDPVRQGGMPRESFPGVTIVEGSAEEEAFFSRKEAEAQRQHRAELARIEREKEEALAQEAAEAALAEQRGEQESAARLAEIERQKEIDAAAAAAEAARLEQEEREARERQRARGEAEREKQKLLQELSERLDSDDLTVRAAALQRALDSGDEAERTVVAAALAKSATDVVDRRRTIGGMFVIEGWSPPVRIPFVLLVDTFDPADGSMSVTIQGPRDFGRAGSSVGQLAGNTLTLGGDDFSVSATYDPETGMFVGRMQASYDSGRVQDGRVSLDLF